MGVEIIQKFQKTAPGTPGVYRMLGKGGQVLYVGKAKNLKKRLMAYTKTDDLPHRLQRMVFETHEVVLVTTRTEAEALLLEANLIKSLKPRYNVTFRDDSSYPFIFISEEATPLLRLHRGSKKAKGHYFGPYPGVRAVHRTIATLEQVFRLRTCRPSVFANRTRPCLKYYIHRCSAPCVGKISSEDYRASVRQALDVLAGRGARARRSIEARMARAARVLNYEEAARERDKLTALTAIQGTASGLSHGLKNADVFAFAMDGPQACAQGFFYRNGQHVGNRAWPVKTQNATPPEVCAAFLSQYYDGHPAPPLVLCSHIPEDSSLLAGALSRKAGRKVTLSSPTRGVRRNIMAQATRNAEETLKKWVDKSTSWRERLDAFGKILGREAPIARMDAFDISNTSGKQAVASLVVAGEDGMERHAYRKFAIKALDTPDDYAMMRQTLERHYGALKKTVEKGESEGVPDVILVDGGKGHLSVLVEVFNRLGMRELLPATTLCAIAKGPERDKGLEVIWRENHEKPLPIAHGSPLIFLLQQVRDEAHRFAIGFHRQKRGRQMKVSGLDDVPGIGAKRKKALLSHLGSVTAVREASIAELTRVPGISAALAEEIHRFFSRSSA